MAESGLLIEVVIIFALILINGFFASAEIAIISARRSTIDKHAKEGSKSARAVARMKENPEPFLSTIQVGITLVATLASVLGGFVAAEVLQPVFNSLLADFPYPWAASASNYVAAAVVVVVIGYTTLVVGELVPKSLALRHAERIAMFSARPLTILSKVASLPVRFLTASTGAVLRMMGMRRKEERVFISEEEIKYFIREGWERGIFEETEAALLHGIFEFADTTVKEVMVPKHKFAAVEENTTPEKTLKTVAESGFSRYPVYRGSYEKVIGVLYSKDVFRALERSEPIIIKDLMRHPYFVPNSIMISKLLREMQRKKVHLAIVVDEHGDVDGLVTIEDILEEIVGEIEDEYDVGKGGQVERLRDGTLIVDASISLRDLEDVGIEIDGEDEEFHTLAGFMLSKLQRVPRGGEFVEYDNMRFTVVDVEMNRIVKVKVEFLKKPAEAREEAQA